MIFRRGPASEEREVPSDSLEARLGALGRLLDRQSFLLPGLCIMGAETGYIVHGYPAARLGLGLAPGPRAVVLHADEVTAEVAAVRARH